MTIQARKIITYENPMGSVSESYRSLRTNIQWSSIDHELRTILITSSEPNAGKSTTAVNLAVSFAQLGKKVVIVDCDMRNPTQHEYFRKSNRQGLSNLLSGQYHLDVCLQDTTIDNVTLLSSGIQPPNPAELLSSERMVQLLRDLKNQFDLIILDSPPSLSVTDTQVIAPRCDGVLFVLRSKRTKWRSAQKALSNLEYVNAKVIGLVLNGKKAGKDVLHYPYGD